MSLSLFDSPRLRAFVERMLAGGAIGTVFAFSGQMAQFVPHGVRQRFVMDFGDVDSAKFAQYADDGAGPMRWVNRREGEKLFAFERATAARADLCLFVSEAEAALFRAKTGLANIRALSNGIDVDFFDPGADFPRLAGEIGGGPADPVHRPDGLRAQCRGRDLVRPRGAAAASPALASPSPAATRRPRCARWPASSVTVTGAVADMRSWLAAADVVVAPLKLARGIQNKVLEAMAMARPVVASPAAFEGIEAVPGRDLLVADDAAAMAEAIRSLLADPDDAPPRWARAARRQMETCYRWDAGSRRSPRSSIRPGAGKRHDRARPPGRAMPRARLANASRRARPRRGRDPASLLPRRRRHRRDLVERARPSTIAC